MTYVIAMCDLCSAKIRLVQQVLTGEGVRLETGFGQLFHRLGDASIDVNSPSENGAKTRSGQLYTSGQRLVAEIRQ